MSVMQQVWCTLEQDVVMDLGLFVDNDCHQESTAPLPLLCSIKAPLSSPSSVESIQPF